MPYAESWRQASGPGGVGGRGEGAGRGGGEERGRGGGKGRGGRKEGRNDYSRFAGKRGVNFRVGVGEGLSAHFRGGSNLGHLFFERGGGGQDLSAHLQGG